jgi:putative PIN family toxin of toxin-antitoxin system
LSYKRQLPRHELYSSPPLIQDLKDILRGKFGLDPQGLPFLKLYQEKVNIIQPTLLPQPICRDPDDDWVLATAVSAKADVIMTGDEDLLVLGSYQWILILSPRQFFEL